jgi:hypothetical protein
LAFAKTVKNQATILRANARQMLALVEMTTCSDFEQILQTWATKQSETLAGSLGTPFYQIKSPTETWFLSGQETTIFYHYYHFV